MNPREPAHHARDAHLGPHPRARTLHEPPRAREDGFSPTPTSKSTGSHHPKTPASPRRWLLTHTNQQIPGLALPQNPREPAKMASHPHQPANPRARTTPKPPRARKDGLSRTPTSKSPGSHHLQTPASPLTMPVTPISGHTPGLIPSDTPYLSQRNTEATQENRQKTTKNRKTTPDRRSSIRPTN